MISLDYNNNRNRKKQSQHTKSRSKMELVDDLLLRKLLNLEFDYQLIALTKVYDLLKRSVANE